MAYAASIVDKQIAEDIVQDVFVYLWHNRKRLNLSDNLTSYLFQAVYTHCLDHLRKNRHAEKYAFFVYENYLEECKSMLKNEEKIVEELSLKEFYERLFFHLNQLSEPRRKVFIMAYIDGLKMKQIAEITDMPLKTVESHLFLARKYLKEHFHQKEYYLLYVFGLFLDQFKEFW